ncbi:outer membrane protein [Xanthobacter agilis]|uniref:outer membrane protein n=1 Tax=Xanthobacter agilis TaxID=47492 RepID=UPI003728477C
MRLVSAVLVAMAAARAALAGDLPVKGVEAPDAGSWTGFYLGTYVGSGLVDSQWSPGATPGTLAAVSSVSGLGSASGAMIGSQIGYNQQVGAFVYGIEGEVGTGFLLSRARCRDGSTSVCAMQTDLVATLTGRLGYAFDNVLVYGKAGAAFLDSSASATGSGYQGQYTGSALRTGWTVGGGAEVGLTPNLSAKAEYAYLNFGTDSIDLKYGVYGGAMSVSQSAQMVKLGLNWRPWGAPLPGTGARLPVPGRDWSGLYAGLHAGGAGGRDEWTSGTGFLADAAVFGAFPGTGTAMGLLGGGQLGFNYQMGPWVAGAEVSASAADLGSYTKCVTNALSMSSFGCHNTVDSLGSISGRLGQSWGDVLFYGKAGAAWVSGSGALFPTTATVQYTTSGTRWGWMLGSGVEYALTRNFSAFLEYDYYDFGTQSLTYSGGGLSATADFKQRLDVVRMGLNYRFGTGPDGAAAASKAPELPAGWTAEIGGRYFASTGRMQKDLMHPALTDRLNSRLIYGNTTGQSLETFFRFENRDGLFLKGFAGLGTLAGGRLNDEDFPSDVVYSNTLSDLRDGSLSYGALDLGYELVRRGESTLGAFVGYRALYQNVNGFGCWQLARDTTCDQASHQQVPALASALALSETETWQAVALGLNSRLQLAERLRLEVDAAYLPYATRSSMDNHWFRADINPQIERGTGWGTQLEAVLSYAVTNRLDVGLGGRYWYFATDGASTGFPQVPIRSPMTFYSERYGAFLQASYRFGDIPPAEADAAGMPTKAEPAPMNWSGLYAGGTLGGGKAHTTYASPFAPPVSGDAVDLGGAMAGGQVGADVQMGAIVLGAEASAAWSNVGGTDTCFSTAPVGAASGFNCGSRVNGLGTVTGRFGYAVDRALVYARGGFAWDRQSDSFNTYAFTGTVPDHQSTNTGWTLGGGIEYALLPNLSVGLEYKHFDFGGASGFTTTWIPLAGLDLAPDSLRLDMVAMTVNYRFLTFSGR